jgi:hypothetical protein
VVRTRRSDARSGERDRSLRTDAPFGLPRAPVGKSRLWLGTRDEFAAGRPRIECALDLQLGDNPPLELDL